MMLKRIAILLLCVPSLFPLNSSRDREVIEKIERIVDDSLTLLQRFGRTGTETVSGKEGGQIIYRTVLTGFNEVLNTIEYINYRREGLILNGLISNRTDWGGSGTSLTELTISGDESCTLKIDMTLCRKIKTDGTYSLFRENCGEVQYSFSSLSSDS